MTIKEIIQKLHTTMIDARGQESHFESWMTQNEGICDAIDALKALDKQEPVAWMFQHDETGRMNYVSNDGIHDPTMFLGMNPRYALVCPLYTSPPQSTQVKLTDEEILEIASPMFEDTRYPSTALDFARAILRKAQKK